jgi:hypothetical protein
MEVGMMRIVSAAVLALSMIAVPTLARMSSSNLSIPSAQNSGVGIHGFAGTEAGSAVRPGIVGSAAARRNDMPVREQDASNIPGRRGTEAGPSVNAPSHLG